MQFAPYIDQWRLRVEQIGTQHYPKGVGDKVYGSVQATLTIRADGSVADIQINRPSDKALLNQAVRRIAQLAAPFAAFPLDMASQIDQLVLTRTWHFVNGSVTTK
jgi:protein TonB